MVNQDLACYYQLLHEKSKAGKKSKEDNFLKKSPPADPPSDILPTASMVINAELDIAGFFDQLHPLLHHYNHFLHHLH
jgi:hypothetical protein